MEEEIRVARTFNEIVEILQRHGRETENIVRTITYNPQFKIIAIKLRDTLNGGVATTEAGRSRATAPIILMETAELRRLSRSVTKTFPELSNSFQDWEPRRMDLIKESEASANNLQWTVLLGSLSRIFTSAADLVATCMRSNGSETSWVQYTLEYAPIVSFLSLFIQASVSSQILDSIKTAIEKDQKLFKPIQTWFQHSQELETAVRNFFPYGIDPKTVAEIEKNEQIPDESIKIFMSVVASNVTNNMSLLTDRDFLSRATIFSTSEAGAKWYRKILLEMDPFLMECFKCSLENQIMEMTSSDTISQPESIVNCALPIRNMTKFKVLFNVLAIFSAVCSIWKKKSYKSSETLREFSVKAKKELDAMKKVFNLLKPSELILDD